MSQVSVHDGGAYLLILRLDRDRRTRVASLGLLDFPRGNYVYAGSALRALSSRVERHFRLEKKLHWHVDHLRACARPIGAFILRGREDMECLLNEMVSHMEGAEPHAPGFGCSDCSCDTHLHFVDAATLVNLKHFIPELWVPSRQYGI